MYIIIIATTFGESWPSIGHTSTPFSLPVFVPDEHVIY